ncbi:MAG TPA: aminoacyl-tRNA hydrolase [Bacteroidia bacterium]|nr:aminoacyl-tRNA hydrolase [Bacteroidia bacterium]
MKFLIVGLGNIGSEYENTRHNIGFKILDTLASASGIFFNPNSRLAFIAEYRFKGRIFIMIKPTTYMNLSGKAVNYWMQKEHIPLENVLVITDDLALPLGALRMKTKGSDGGHNGLKSINETLGTTDYTRLRFGVGNDFPKGRQVEYVLGKWTEEDEKKLPARIDMAIEMIKSFATTGPQHTMTAYNNK